MNDDELLEVLASALRQEAPTEPAPERVEMLRRMAAATAAESPIARSVADPTPEAGSESSSAEVFELVDDTGARTAVILSDTCRPLAP